MASLVIATRKSIYNTPSKLYNAPKILQEKMIRECGTCFFWVKLIKISPSRTKFFNKFPFYKLLNLGEA